MDSRLLLQHDQRAFRAHATSVSRGMPARRQQLLFVYAAGPAFLDALSGDACLLTFVGQTFARFLRTRGDDESMDCEEFLMALHFLRCQKSEADWMNETRDSFDDFGWPPLVDHFVFVYLKKQSRASGGGDPNPWRWWADEAAAVGEKAALREVSVHATEPARRADAAAQAAARAAASALDAACRTIAAAVERASAAAAQRASEEELTRARAQLLRDAALASAESDARWEEFQHLGRRLTAGLATALGAMGAMDSGGGSAGAPAGALSTLLEESDAWSDDDESAGAAAGSSLWQPPIGAVAEVADACQVRRAVARDFVRLARRRGARSTAQCIELLIEHGGVLPFAMRSGGADTETRIGNIENIEGEAAVYVDVDVGGAASKREDIDGTSRARDDTHGGHGGGARATKENGM